MKKKVLFASTMYLHPFDEIEPEIINSVSVNNKADSKVIVIATQNKNKLQEFERLMPKYKVLGANIKLDEIQSMDPEKVAHDKAIKAWEQNNYNPVLVEDTSMEILGLGGLPGPFLTYFISQVEMRRLITDKWLKDADRRAVARTILAIYDGREVHSFEGKVEGVIAENLLGADSFGFDDMFVPTARENKNKLTFAQMKPREKDKYSMRRVAVEAFLKEDLNLFYPVFACPEPFDSELTRINHSKLKDKKAIKFAFQIEGIEKLNKPNPDFQASSYNNITTIENKFYRRYLTSPDSNSIGIVISDIDRAKSMITKSGDPIFWEIGPKRRTLALAQRSEYFLENTKKEVIKQITDIESGKTKITLRPNKQHEAVERILAMSNGNPLEAHSLQELGYKKISSEKNVSRTTISQFGLFNKIGKYPRSFLGIGSMPGVSGWRDVITTSIIGHMPVFIARNNIFAENDEQRIKLINEVRDKVKELALGKKLENIVTRNIGVAIGSNPNEDPKKAQILYKKAGVKMFRIYTINGDPRIVNTAINLRKLLGDEIEIFVGQISDLYQAKKLVEKAQVDGLLFGHGGGRQCTSAINGMAISAVEDIYSAILDPDFNETSLIQEGGVGKNVGPLLILGLDGILYNQQLTRGTIESGGLFLKNKSGEIGQPYHGSASAPTMIVESANPKLAHRVNASGRTKVPEGKPGFLKYTSKANSMAFWVSEFRHHLARTLADLGVSDISELRNLVRDDKREFLRIVSSGAAAVAQAYRS